VLLGEDVGKLGGVFRATQGLQKTFGEDRVMDTPLAEAGIIGASIGLAMNGMKPIPEIQFMGFVLPAMNQILGHAARLRNRTRGRFTVPMVVRMPCGGGIHAPEHHSESSEAYFTHTPGLKVVMPSTPHDMKGLLLASIEDPDTVLFLEHKRIYRAVKGEVAENYYTIPLGKADVVCKGTDLTIVTWGYMRHLSERVAAELAEQNVSVEVIDLRTLAPFDEEAILTSVAKTGRLLVVHEAPRNCGLGAEICSLVCEKAIYSLKAAPKRVTGYDITMPLPKGEDLYIPSEERIVHAIQQILSE